MDYKLLEQWLAELLPKDAKPLVKQLVECAAENPGLQFMMGMNVVYPALQDSSKEVQAAAINALITGICLSQAWKNQGPAVEENLRGFLDYMAKKRGENVIGFFQARAGRDKK